MIGIVSIGVDRWRNRKQVINEVLEGILYFIELKVK